MKKLHVGICIMLLLTLLFFISPTEEVQAAGEGWLSGFDYRKNHTISSAAGAGANYQVEMIVHYDDAPLDRWDYNSNWAIADANSIQGVATDGTWVYTTQSVWLRNYSKAGALQDTAANPHQNGTAMNQVNSAHYYDGKLYLGSSNYPDAPKNGYIKVFNATTLYFIEEHQIATSHWNEGCARKSDGTWWVVYQDWPYVSKYSAAWVHQADYELTFKHISMTANLYQGIVWEGDFIYVNHHDGYYPAVVDVYKWTGSGFEPIDRIPQPATKGGQGFGNDPTESDRWWFAQRDIGGTHYIANVTEHQAVDCESHCQTDFDDIRFTDDDGSTELDYWMENKSDGYWANFWVEVADSLTSNRSIFMYYGNLAASTASNGTNTFEFFENFTTDTFDERGLGDGTWTVSGGTVDIDEDVAGGGLDYGIIINTTFTVNGNSSQQLQTRMKPTVLKELHGVYFRDTVFSDATVFYKFAGTQGFGLTPNLTHVLGTGVWQVVNTVLDDFSGAKPILLMEDDDASAGAEMMFDWFFIRKFNYTEPTNGAWASESTYPTIIYSKQTGKWQSTSTWKYADIPGTGESAIIADGHTVWMDDNRSASYLSVNSTATLTVNSTYVLDIGSNLTVNGTLEVRGTVNHSHYWSFYRNGGAIWLNNSTVEYADMALPFNFYVGHHSNSSINDYRANMGTYDLLVAISSETYSAKGSGIVWHMNATVQCVACFEAVEVDFGNLTAGESYRLYNNGVLVGTKTADGSGMVFFTTTIDDTADHLNLTHYSAPTPDVGPWVDILPIAVQIRYEYDLFSNVHVWLDVNESYPVMDYFVWRSEGRRWVTLEPHLNFSESWELRDDVPLTVEVRNTEGVKAELSATVQIDHTWIIILAFAIIFCVTVSYLVASRYDAIMRKLRKDVKI